MARLSTAARLTDETELIHPSIHLLPCRVTESAWSLSSCLQAGVGGSPRIAGPMQPQPFTPWSANSPTFGQWERGGGAAQKSPWSPGDSYGNILSLRQQCCCASVVPNITLFHDCLWAFLHKSGPVRDKETLPLNWKKPDISLLNLIHSVQRMFQHTASARDHFLPFSSDCRTKFANLSYLI